jgi:hypothetical protein
MSELETILSGWPDRLLTVVLVGIGTLLILVGLFAPVVVKVPFAVWAIG